MSTEKKKNWKVYIPLTVVVLGVIIGAVLWYVDYSKYIQTDDAKIECDNVAISSKILGRIAKLYKEEADSVKSGELLVELDSTDLIAQYAQLQAAKLQAIANKSQLSAKYDFDAENLKVVQINLDRAKEDFDRAKNQFNNDVISKEQFDHAKKAFESAQAQMDAAKTQLKVSEAQISSAEAAVATSDAQIGVVLAQLKNVRLYAPMDGVIAKLWSLPGEIIQPGQSVFSLSNNQKYWVTIYLEETKMQGVHVNQKVKFSIDAYPEVDFRGEIFSISNNTASQFSLIPASNASGNFTKVTQRIPIKISIETANGDKNLEKYPLFAGMSVVAKIIKD